MASHKSRQEWKDSVTSMLAGINKYEKEQCLLVACRPNDMHNDLTFIYGRYNPENIEMLEQYVGYQVDAEDYNFEANLALMKL